MSRSYKHTPVHKDLNVHNVGKKYANKKCRRTKEGDTSSKAGWKRNYEQYDIHDWVSFWTKEDAIAAWEEEEKDLENGIGICPNYSYHKIYDNDIDKYLWAVWGKYYHRK